MYDNVYFFIDAKGSNGEITKKGCAVRASLDQALQSFYAYLGAYAYGMEEGTDFVQVAVMDSAGHTITAKTWKKPEPEPEPEPTPEPEEV